MNRNERIARSVLRGVPKEGTIATNYLTMLSEIVKALNIATGINGIGKQKRLRVRRAV